MYVFIKSLVSVKRKDDPGAKIEEHLKEGGVSRVKRIKTKSYSLHVTKGH